MRLNMRRKAPNQRIDNYLINKGTVIVWAESDKQDSMVVIPRECFDEIIRAIKEESWRETIQCDNDLFLGATILREGVILNKPKGRAEAISAGNLLEIRDFAEGHGL